MNRRTVDTRLSSAPTHLIKREPGNEARSWLDSLPGLHPKLGASQNESAYGSVPDPF